MEGYLKPRVLLLLVLPICFTFGCNSPPKNSGPKSLAPGETIETFEVPLVPVADNRLRVDFQKPFAEPPAVQVKIVERDAPDLKLEVIERRPDYFVVQTPPASFLKKEYTLRYTAVGNPSIVGK
jgi:hypothetical protein